MPTNIQRASSIADALINGTATNQMMLRVAESFFVADKPTAYAGMEFSALTNEQKAGVLIQAMRKVCLKVVSDFDKRSAAIIYNDSVASVNTDVDTEFLEN